MEFGVFPPALIGGDGPNVLDRVLAGSSRTEELERFREAGADRYVFLLPPWPAGETRGKLERLAKRALAG